MKSTHRKVNNVGYRKIYPMSSGEDNTICHYCGRSAGIKLKLTNDHVPPLNVKIPPEFIEAVKKTLVRACSECNSLAGDIPHMDYLERHLWLKSRYIQRYKSTIINHESKNDTCNEHPTTPLEIEGQRDYEEIMRMLGFGLIDSTQIKSPFLKTKTTTGKTIAELIDEHVYGVPNHDYDSIEEDTNPSSHTNSSIKKPEEEVNKNDELDFFLEFLTRENDARNYIYDQSSYIEWADSHPSRFNALDLPEKPEAYFNISWTELTNRITPTVINEESETNEIQTKTNKNTNPTLANKKIPKLAKIKSVPYHPETHITNNNPKSENRFTTPASTLSKIESTITPTEAINHILKMRNGNSLHHPLTSEELKFILSFDQNLKNSINYRKWRNTLDSATKTFLPTYPETVFGDTFWKEVLSQS